MSGVQGILLLDKPLGCTSNQALVQVKRWFGARKAGHTGSLDPLATGLLPLCFGEATKLSGWLLDADKGYHASAQLGLVTDSGDLAGRVLAEHPVPALTPEALEAACAGLRGAILQVPPMTSALKHQGQRLYQLARQGLEVERAARPVTIHALDVWLEAPDRLRLEVRCSKGTYIRTLVQDLGKALGCGATVTVLRRTRLGTFAADGMHTLEALERRHAEAGVAGLRDWLLPADHALEHWPAVYLSAEAARRLGQGQAIDGAVPTSGDAPVECLQRIYAPEGHFLGIGWVDGQGVLTPKRLFQSAA